MSRYISVDDLQAYCDNKKDHSITPNEFHRMDSIRIVRCCECMYRETCIHSTYQGDDEEGEHGFCSWGKPKDGEQE